LLAKENEPPNAASSDSLFLGTELNTRLFRAFLDPEMEVRDHASGALLKIDPMPLR